MTLSACVPGAAPVADPEPVASSTPTPTPEPPPLVVSPLRGTLVDPASVAHPALSAKIDDHEDARPQIGLERADIVFEELVEGGLTRYVAVWHSDIPELIGPVRSVRPMDPDILTPIGGIVAYSGGQQQFVDMMEATPLYNAVHGNADTEETFYRIDGYDSPHDVVVNAQQLVAEHSDLAAPAQQFAYAPDAAAATAAAVAVGGQQTASLELVFSSSSARSWSWDAASGTFLRSQDGLPDVAESGAAISAANVVSLRVDEVYDYDAEVPRAVMVASGEAWVSIGGVTQHATWSKASMAASILLVDDTGAQVQLAPGTTWVELVPLETGSVAVVPPAPAEAPVDDAG
ncbi:DUF3048 domain-containing protein [Herbiconiux moechotypicola]|uniref:DUF3048 domain-containing protein n=1 Tax=Herbiconiux moechotypicola TaxID=637393 RepID=UPI00217D1809|nr:DUF3048 domain-containing protein [Herbiconiux moechotypicola]MCS5730701.1 DUF3048 domain-containing protein [Herbiconiux moechotypicola]